MTIDTLYYVTLCSTVSMLSLIYTQCIVCTGVHAEDIRHALVTISKRYISEEHTVCSPVVSEEIHVSMSLYRF